jgi:hypothetical protein
MNRGDRRERIFQDGEEWRSFLAVLVEPGREAGAPERSITREPQSWA